MILYNKGQRIIQYTGGVLRPQVKKEIDDAMANMLLKYYPKELISFEAEKPKEIKHVEAEPKEVVKKKTSRKKVSKKK